jgi:hypothetical protein
MVNDIAQKQRTINNCLHTFSFTTSTLDNTDVAIKNGQSRKTGNIEYKGRWQTMQKHNTICAGHHYTQTNTNNVSKTWASYKQREVKTNRTCLMILCWLSKCRLRSSEEYLNYIQKEMFEGSKGIWTTQHLRNRYAKTITHHWVSSLVLRRIWRHQRGNHNLYIKDEHTTQWSKEKVQRTNNDLQSIHIKLKIE